MAPRHLLPSDVPKQRTFVPNITKLRAVDCYNKFLATSPPKNALALYKQAVPTIPASSMFRWRRNETEERRDVDNVQVRRMCVTGNCIDRHLEGWFPVAEERVMEWFREARKKGLVCNELWFSTTMTKIHKDMFPPDVRCSWA